MPKKRALSEFLLPLGPSFDVVTSDGRAAIKASVEAGESPRLDWKQDGPNSLAARFLEGIELRVSRVLVCETPTILAKKWTVYIDGIGVAMYSHEPLEMQLLAEEIVRRLVEVRLGPSLMVEKALGEFGRALLAGSCAIRGRA